MMITIPDTLKTQIPKKLGIQSFGRLRWVFKFADRPDKVGVWNNATNNFEESAAYISKTGIVYAAIQIEIMGQWTARTMFECDGHDYVSSRWIGATSAGSGIGLKGKYQLSPSIIGLCFVTRTENVSCFVDGSMSRKPLSAYDKKFNIREHRV
jgi:hypothetical protein